MESIIQKTKHTFELIKFSHSIFALPFALASMLVAARGWPSTNTFLLIIMAMVAARSAAMAFNRLLDAEIDAKNPRTQNRHIPQGILSKKFVALFTIVCCTVFVATCAFINPLSFLLSPFVLIWLLAYSFTKRFTCGSHLWLGTSLGLAPLGAWIAVTGNWPWPALSLAAAVTLWVAGFDILYAAQDFEFDRKMGLQSIVARFGLAKALRLSRLFHGAGFLLLLLFGVQNQLGVIYFIAVFLIGVGLFYEQRLVKPNDLSKIDAAFFNTNGLISFLFLIGTALDITAR